LTPLGGLEETAGYKGYGLNMMVEILCAVLSGCHKVGPDVPPWRVDRGTPVDYGHCFICIDPTKLLPTGDFQKALSGYLSTMRQLPPGDAAQSVLVPGDPERAEEGDAAKHGVRLNLQISLGLRALAQSFNCSQMLPQEIQGLPERATAPKHPHTV
jgi:LDH2 family malate/lactate/ureidoglycolate dehydrogenase